MSVPLKKSANHKKIFKQQIVTLLKSVESSTSWRNVSLAEKLSVSLVDDMEDNGVIELDKHDEDNQNDRATF